MNKQIISLTNLLVMCFCTALGFSSCEQSLPLENEPGLIIRLQVPPPLDVTTKGGQLDNITISNVWVLQYNEQNNALLKAQVFSGTDIADKASQGVLEVNTTGFFENESRFYVIANAGEDFLADSELSGETAIKESALKAKTKAIIQGASGEPTLLSAKPIKMTVESIKESGGKAVIVAPLERAFARVNVEWNKKNLVGDVKIRKVEVANLPKNMAVYARAGGDLNSTYPEVSAENMYLTNYAIVNIDATNVPGGWEVGSKQTFYMAENLRGMGTGTTFTEKNLTGKGPDGSLEGCTYVLLSGEYIYPGATDPIGVQYKIYLGGNLTNDYNIQRGYSYDLKVSISGANSADVRVTITNGNVAVFDDVVQMPNNEVSFN